MPQIDLQEKQKSLRTEYEENPEAAQLTLTATAEEQDGHWACSVDTGHADWKVEMSEEVGGPGAAPCPGDHLLGALAACSQILAQTIAEQSDIDADISVEVSGDTDLRGEMAINDDVPVGVQDIRLNVSVDGDLEEHEKKVLQKYTERYCAVYHTLADPPTVETAWEFQ